MEIKGFVEYMKEKQTVTDFTNDGVCSGCGECCSDILPLTNKDIKRIQKYIDKHDIKLSPKRADIDMTCPFLDIKHKCKIYEMRPRVCQVFKCDKKLTKSMANSVKGAKIYSMRKLFGSDGSIQDVIDCNIRMNNSRRLI